MNEIFAYKVLDREKYYVAVTGGKKAFCSTDNEIAAFLKLDINKYISALIEFGAIKGQREYFFNSEKECNVFIEFIQSVLIMDLLDN